VRARGKACPAQPRRGADQRWPTAFDLWTDRKVRYSLLEGGPDPPTLANDREVLAGVVSATIESWEGRRISPV